MMAVWSGWRFGMSTTVSSIKPIPPVRFDGTVVHGHGRGGSQLGFPTANLDAEAVAGVSLEDGVYCGFARVGGDTYLPMVMSVGWNPHFEDPTRSVEVHILKQFPDDFYGSTIDVDVRGYIRSQQPFSTLKHLVAAIQADCDAAQAFLRESAPAAE